MQGDDWETSAPPSNAPQPAPAPAAYEPNAPNKRVIAITVVSLLAISFVVLFADDLKVPLQLMRFDLNCSSGDTTACGLAAIKRMKNANGREDALRARDELQAACAMGHRKSCRVNAYVGSMWFGRWRGKTGNRYATLNPKCEAGNALACAAITDRGSTSTERSAHAAELCKANPNDWVACRVWAEHQRRWQFLVRTGSEQSGPDTDAFKAACAAGAKYYCGEPFEGRYLTRIRRSYDGPRQECYAGYLPACADVASDDPTEKAVFEALDRAKTLRHNPGLYRVELPNADFSAACSNGSEVACLAAGLLLVGDGTETTPKPLPSAAALDATFGAACRKGMHISCMAHAFRILDRPLAESPNEAAANAALQPACAAGSAKACWLQSHAEAVKGGDWSERLEVAQHACKLGANGACSTYFAGIAHSEGADPWMIDDYFSFAVLPRSVPQ